LDAAKHIIEEGNIQANSASTHEWWAVYRTFYKGVNPQAMTVAEIWDTSELNAEYVQGDEVDLSFEFFLAYSLIESVNSGDSTAVSNKIEESFGMVPDLQLATFITNHDQDRSMTQFGNDPNKARVAASILMTAPGVPFVFYGEEIGLEGAKPDERIRAPMSWSAEQNAGFTSTAPWEDLAPEWEVYNVALETNDPTSLLSHYRSLIQARNQHAALRVGDYNLVTPGNEGVYSILRVSQGEALLAVVNLTGDTISDYSLSLTQSDLEEGSYSLAAIMGTGDISGLTVDASGGFSGFVPLTSLPPYSTYIFQLQN
jgi:glycosidase